MDPISHYLVGAAIGALRPAGTVPALYWAAVAGAVVPDIDFVVRLWGGRQAYLDAHRGATHGPIGWVAGATGITAVLHWIDPGSSWPMLFLWALGGILSHVLLDLTNAYGTQALWPWSRQRYAWDLTFVVDIPILVIGFLSMVLVAAWPDRRIPLAVAVLGFILGYLILRAAIHKQVHSAVWARFAPLGPVRWSVIPAMWGLNRWRYIVEVGEQYLTGFVTWRPLQTGAPHRYSRCADKIVAAARTAPAAQLLGRFSRHSNASWHQEGKYYMVRFYDMQYENGLVNPFVAVVTLDQELNVIEDHLSNELPNLRKAGSFLRQEFQRKK